MDETQTLPRFSVVVPTHGGMSMIEHLLTSLYSARKQYPAETEIIVVDSSSAGETAQIQAMCNEWDSKYTWAENDVRRKRNIGICQAQYDTIFFIDSDCEADLNVFNEHAIAHCRSSSDVSGVLGFTDWTGYRSDVWNVLQYSSSLTAAFSFAAWFPEVPWGTCTNLSVKRSALNQIGGFDETMPLRVYGEDVDLGLRLGKAGHRIISNPKAIVFHNRSSLNNLWVVLRKTFMMGRADFHLERRHPDRSELEFPGAVTFNLLLLVIALVKLGVFGSYWMLIKSALWLPLLMLCQAVFAIRQARESWKCLPYRLGASLLEIAFEAGRLWESLRHGNISQLWTKFVYVTQQLGPERDRRIVQMWAALILLAMMVIL